MYIVPPELNSTAHFRIQLVIINKHNHYIFAAAGIAAGSRLDVLGIKSSSPGKVKNFQFSMLSRPTLGSTQPSIQFVPLAFPGSKAAGA
jgi:hypothetical protein